MTDGPGQMPGAVCAVVRPVSLAAGALVPAGVS